MSENRFIGIYLHKLTKPRIYDVLIFPNWLETMICFGFGTLHWERTVSDKKVEKHKKKNRIIY